MTITATYSPEDNKLRLYPAHRLPKELYDRVRASGFAWAPKQELFVAPMWTPERAELCEELAGQIDDEDRTLSDRAEERAERFDGYSENRAADAESARQAVAGISQRFELGQPILIGHHSEKRARRDKEKMDNGMRRAVKMWETSQYWTDRAASAIRHAKYKERPDVRARRIRNIEADLRKLDRSDKETADNLRLWALVDQPEKWKAREDGTMLTREERAAYIAGKMSGGYVNRTADGRTWTAYDVLRLPAESRYKGTPEMTVDEVLAAVKRAQKRAEERRARWREHYGNRLTYERAMLAADGGIESDKVKPEKGGAVRCWASPGYGKGWAYIQKVNRVSVTLWDTYSGDRFFTRNIPFDKLHEIMPAAQVAELRTAGRLAEIATSSGAKIGFYVRPEGDDESRAPTRAEAAEIAHREAVANAEKEKADAAAFAAMRETLRNGGVQVVTAPQLFPTPAELAARMVELADVRPGHRVLEPSAGTGAILDAMNSHPGEVVAVEINGALCRRLNTHPQVSRTEERDFLQCNGDLGAFDRIMMNPPFENGADIKHIRHAAGMLKPGGRLVAICANGPRQREALQPIAAHWEDLPAGTFKDAGTLVNTSLLVIDA